MTPANEALLAAMREAPDDDGPRLVYADWLLAQGDPRGELIVLEHRERTTRRGIIDAAALERLLLLAAEHGFPQLPDDPDAHLLPWVGGGSHPVQYEVDHGGHHYYLRYRHADFSIEIDDMHYAELDLDVTDDGDWTDSETNLILTIVDASIQAGADLGALAFPRRMELHRHPAYRLGRFPRYVLPDELGAERERWTLGARDRDRWYRLWKRLLHLRRASGPTQAA